MKIYIKCHFQTEEQADRSDIIDQETPLTEMVEREVTFYSIAALSPYIEKGVEYTSIVSGSTSYVSKLKRLEIEKIIEHFYAVSN